MKKNNVLSKSEALRLPGREGNGLGQTSPSEKIEEVCSNDCPYRIGESLKKTL